MYLASSQCCRPLWAAGPWNRCRFAQQFKGIDFELLSQPFNRVQRQVATTSLDVPDHGPVAAHHLAVGILVHAQ